MDSSLVGKQEEELTQEQRTLEGKFTQKNLEEFIELINQDMIMVHATSVPISMFLKEGILARSRVRSKRTQSYDDLDSWQEKVANDITRPRLQAFLDIHRKLIKDEVTSDEYESEIERILEHAPEPGRARLEHFFRKVVPELEQKGFLSEKVWPRFNQGFFNYEGVDSTRLFKNPTRDDYLPDGRFTTDEKKAMFTGNLAHVIAGSGLISASDASFMKRMFCEGSSLLSSTHHDRLSIYFDKPTDKRQLYSISARTGEDFDTGVASKVGSWHFRALRFGYYDRHKRTLYLESGFHYSAGPISSSDLIPMQELQEKGMLFFDQNLIPLPPLASIAVVDAPDKKDKRYLNQIMKLGQENAAYARRETRKVLERKGYLAEWQALTDVHAAKKNDEDHFP